MLHHLRLQALVHHDISCHTDCCREAPERHTCCIDLSGPTREFVRHSTVISVHVACCSRVMAIPLVPSAWRAISVRQDGAPEVTQLITCGVGVIRSHHENQRMGATEQTRAYQYDTRDMQQFMSGSSVPDMKSRHVPHTRQHNK